MGVVVLVLFVAFLAVSYWATARIIAQAGYSSAWVLVPLSSLVLTVVVFVMIYVDLRSLAEAVPFGFGGSDLGFQIKSVEVVWDIDLCSMLVNWILFLVFGFSRWPGTAGADAGGRTPTPPPASGASPYGRNVPGPLRPPGASFASASRPGSSPTLVGSVNEVDPRDASTSSAPPPSTAGGIRVKHCVWCGEALPGSRALFHDCGSSDRSATNCATCGGALSGEGAACAACSSGQ